MEQERRESGGRPEEKQANAAPGKQKRSRKQKRKRYQGPGCMYQIVNMTVSIMVAALIGVVIVEVLMLHR